MRPKDYGKCECGGDLRPVWCKEDVYDSYMRRTGEQRWIVSHLVCEECLREYIVDDSFDPCM